MPIRAPLAFSSFESDGKIRFRFKIEMKFLANERGSGSGGGAKGEEWDAKDMRRII